VEELGVNAMQVDQCKPSKEKHIGEGSRYEEYGGVEGGNDKQAGVGQVACQGDNHGGGGDGVMHLLKNARAASE
jgi:hypothetical protein